MSRFRASVLSVSFLFLIVGGLAGCADGPPSASNGPGIENPAAAAPNSIVPAVGTAGNGGGVSGGGAGAAVGH